MFKIYRANVRVSVEPIVVIVSSFKNHGGYFKGESFCVFSKPDLGHVFTEIKFDQKSFEDSPIELTEEFMLEEAIGQAKIDIAQKLESQSQANGHTLQVSEIVLSDVGIAFLVHLSVRGSVSFLYSVIQKTSCNELREALSPLLNLPKLTRNRID